MEHLYFSRVQPKITKEEEESKISMRVLVTQDEHPVVDATVSAIITSETGEETHRVLYDDGIGTPTSNFVLYFWCYKLCLITIRRSSLSLLHLCIKKYSSPFRKLVKISQSAASFSHYSGILLILSLLLFLHIHQRHADTGLYHTTEAVSWTRLVVLTPDCRGLKLALTNHPTITGHNFNYHELYRTLHWLMNPLNSPLLLSLSRLPDHLPI